MPTMVEIAAVFHRPDGSLIKVGSAPLREMLRFRQRDDTDPEAGGVLLGRLIDGARDVVIDEVTVPSRGDRRSHLRFFRSRRGAQRRIRAAWLESQQTQNYLGEWHTHPEDSPAPSGIDLADWARIVGQSRFDQEALIFLIVGRQGLGAWELHRGKTIPSRLAPSSAPRRGVPRWP